MISKIPKTFKVYIRADESSHIQLKIYSIHKPDPKKQQRDWNNLPHNSE